jgi:hypothetical protein
MKILIWSVTVVLAVLGTGLLALLAFTVGWVSDNMATGANWIERLSQLPVPGWLSLFLDPAAAEWVRSVLAAGMGAMAAGLPWLAPVLGWLVPVMWVIWAIVLVGLVAVASGLHYAVGRKRRSAH